MLYWDLTGFALGSKVLEKDRFERFFHRCGIDLDRTTKARWMIQLSELVKPLINCLFDDLIETPIIHSDETTIQVLNEPHRRPESKSYMWTLGRRGPKPIIFYRYHENRNKKSASDLLSE